MLVCFFFFFKQKTAYEMRISDWSSDVCSSDLVVASLCRAADAVAHAWPTCFTDHARQGNGGVRTTASAPAQAVRRGRDSRQDERRGRQLECALRGLPGRRLAARDAGFHRRTWPRAEPGDQADRAPRREWKSAVMGKRGEDSIKDGRR